MSWHLDEIAWDAFDASKVTPDLLRIAKAACLVEHNGHDYGTYLCTVFADDAEFCAAALIWAAEEVKHGMVLRRWVERADPTFDFDDAFRRFTAKIKVPLAAGRSVRGSRCGELIARCVVEVGTSSMYSALRDSTDEPLFGDICHRIAGDEFRHYKLFYDQIKRYRDQERTFLIQRVWVGVRRLIEAEDDELAYAYYCANGIREPYRRRAVGRVYARQTFSRYRQKHIELGAAMVLKAMGVRPQSWYGRLLGRMLTWLAGIKAAQASASIQPA
jgi:hypothetical protein